MPTSVDSLLKSEGLSLGGRVDWGNALPTKNPGVYIVALTKNPAQIVTLPQAPISEEYVQNWIYKVPKLTLDNQRPNCIQLKERLARFWLSDETIIYIGKAGTSLKTRVNQYYKTPLGDKRPHAGGHWIKTLSILEDLSVYWVEISSPEIIESLLIKQFIKHVSANNLNLLFDPFNPFPFANLENKEFLLNGITKKFIKKHGIEGSVNRD